MNPIFASNATLAAASSRRRLRLCSVAASSLLLILLLPLLARPSLAARPKPAPPDTPWEDLRGLLSSPDVITIPTPSIWEDQCLRPMVFDDTTGAPPEGFHLSGYDISDQPAGVCMITMSCIYEDCAYPYATDPLPSLNAFVSPPFDASDVFEEKMELPAAVLHPRAASDVVRGVEFAARHGIGITVKVAGHSFFGSSTARGTLLIKMSSFYPRYATGGSLTECDTDTGEGVEGVDIDIDGDGDGGSSAVAASCALAVARNKNAVLRAGGGELFDEAYRAVFFDWNEDPANASGRKYHFVGGYCGTVSAAGGWLQSGGLSGASMRLHGVGVDQVLHLEMVLPDGRHVRFGPSAWVEEGGFEIPRTTEVTGYCNANPHAADESEWEWADCEGDDVDFEGLWFAVRGGGGGTFGIVTSVYYQLHDLPGAYQQTIINGELLEYHPAWLAIVEQYLRFTMSFLFMPETLNNVTELESRSCNSPGAFLTAPVAGFLSCHHSAGTKLIDEWKLYLQRPEVQEMLMGAGVGNETFSEMLVGAGVDDDTIAAISASFAAGGIDIDTLSVKAYLENFMFLVNEYPSIAHASIQADGPHKGRLLDDDGVKFANNIVGPGREHVPIDTVTDHFDEFISLSLQEVARGSFTGLYLMGGAIPFAQDQTDSLSPNRRTAAFSRDSLAPTSNRFYDWPPPKGGKEDLYTAFYELIYRDIGTDGPFPGVNCHNHATVEVMGPLKEDWSKPCPSLLDWSQAEREEKCVSQAEAFWGTANADRLEKIKASVDPDNLFICAAGIGWTTGEDDGETPSPTPPTTVEEPTGSGSACLPPFALFGIFNVALNMFSLVY